MKICVLIPSEDALMQAGVRIRYGRIQHVLADRGHDLDIRPIESFTSRAQFEHDVYIVSKVYDARSLVVARLLAGSSVLVGADLFDDYFTQTDDTRLVRFQQWIEAFCASASFMLCSTPAMKGIAERFAPGIPHFVMNDPSPPIEAADVLAKAQRKLAETRRTRLLRVGWFGVGDNQFFPVGLHDLAYCTDALAAMRGRGFEVLLRILTNPRALTSHNLALLSRLPVPYEIQAWSEEAEQEIIDESLVCLLPVNAQNFSVAKSLNRAISCLSAGTQALSVGYPLYRPLGAFVYRSPEALMDDLIAQRLAIRDETMRQLIDVLKQWADPLDEADRLVAFFQGAKPKAGPPILDDDRAPAVAVVHGQRSQGDIHKFAQRLQMLSVSSPFCGLRLNFDVRFDFAADGPGIAAYISERWAARLSDAQRAILSTHGRIVDTVYKRIDLSQIPAKAGFVAAPLGRLNSLAATTAAYTPIMADIEKVLEFFFPGLVCYFSETSRLPWRGPAPANIRRLAS